MTCSACGAANPADAKYCNQCGATLSGGCPRCGHLNPPDSRFCNDCGLDLDPAVAPSGPAPDVSAPAPQATPPATGPATMTGERKQVTVLFADVTGFTSMSEQLDPEDMHNIINRCFELLVREVHRHEGTINQFTGDGIMALFGAPVARPDSPQRAVLAALSIQHALEDLEEDLQQERGITFRMRVGLNTGLAVVGTVGSAGRSDYTAVGDTTNLASRMEQMAEPGTILITEHTFRLVQRDFVCEPLGPRAVKGKAEPVKVYRVVGLTEGHGHGGLGERGALTPFVGRDEEMRTVKKHVERALAGDARVIGIMGEVGVGKSRLVHEVLDATDRERVTVAEGHCLSYGAGVAYMPFVDLMRDLEPRLAAAGQDAAALQHLFGSGDGDADEAHGLGLGDLLVAGPREPQGTDGDGAADVKHGIFSGILDTLFEASARGPLLLVIEDLQWIDPTSEEVLGALIRGMAGKRLCVICTFTPGYRFPWADRSYYRHVTIDALSRESSTAIVRSLLGGARVPPELLALIQEEAEGNPHYIEASLRMLQEDGFLEQTPEGVRIARPLAEAHIPDSIQDIVMANIDRLADPVKRTLQVAAVIGRAFEVPLLRTVLRAEHITPHLEELVAAELIQSRSGDTYVFRQGVTRDVAYAGLLRSHRRQLHGMVGRAMEWVFAGNLRDMSPRIGHHFAQGNEPDCAIHYLRMAAERAQQLGVVNEGADRLDQALALLDTLPDAPAERRLRVDLLDETANLRFLGGAVETAAKLWAEALELAKAEDYREKMGALSVNLGGLGSLGVGSREKALDLLEYGLQLCEEDGDETTLARGYMHLGNALRAVGRWAEARTCFEHMVAIGERLPHTLGDVVGPSILASVATDTGRLAQAKTYARQALAAGETHKSDWARSFAAAFASDVYFEAGDYAEAERLAQLGLELGERLNVDFAISNARATLGRLAFARGDYREALRVFKQFLDSGRGILGYAMHVRLGETALALGRVVQAAGYATAALERNPSLKDIGRAERLMAHVLLHQHPPDLEQARELIQRTVERYQALDMPLELGLSLAVEGCLARVSGDAAAAQNRFDQAAALFDATGAQWRTSELHRLMKETKTHVTTVL